MGSRGWFVLLAIATGCAGRARPVAPPVVAPIAIAPAAPMMAPPRVAMTVMPAKTAMIAKPAMTTPPIITAPTRAHGDVAALPTDDRGVVRALSRAQPSFLRCFRRAQRIDPALVRATVTVEAQLTPSGQLELARADAPTPAFGACVIAVAQALRFEHPSAPVRIVLPLRFAAP